jgi:thymidylate synthase
MAEIDKSYHKLVNEILTNGQVYEDPNRKDINRIQIPSYTFEHDFKDGFPAITTKKLAWKSVVGESLWILRGDTSIKYLEDNNIPIWRKDAYNYYIKQNTSGTEKEFKRGINIKNHIAGGLGKVYGYQLRSFGGEFDQLKWIVDTMTNNPRATKKAVTYINPCDKEQQALTPCHTGWEILVEETDYSIASKTALEDHIPEYQFTLQWTQSSCDVFHGIPFNIASYAKLAKFLEVVTGMKARGIRGILSNVHIYKPHLSAVREQLTNDVDKYRNCEMEISEYLKGSIENDGYIDSVLKNAEISDFKLKGYESYPKITAEMLPYSN